MTNSSKLTMALLLIVFPYAYLNAQIPNHPIAAGAASVMTDSNGVITAPTNFFSANSNALRMATASPGGLFSANLVPAGAVFDSSGSYSLSTTLSNAAYIVQFDERDWASTGILGFELDADDLSLDPSPFFGTNQIMLITDANSQNPFAFNGGVAGQPVRSRIYTYGVSNTLGGNFAGTFTGTIDPTTSIQVASLPSLVQLKTSPLISFAGPSDEANIVQGSNTLRGSTFYIWANGNHGYADIGFFTDGSDVFHANLKGAIGAGVSGTNQFPYNEPYYECYGNHSWWWVQSGRIFGGCNGTNGDFAWYRNKSSDADESTKMFDISRAGGVVSNLCQVYVQSNLTAAAALIFQPGTKPSAAQLGSNGVGLWNSNGVLFALGSANGSGYSFTNKIAP